MDCECFFVFTSSWGLTFLVFWNINRNGLRMFFCFYIIMGPDVSGVLEYKQEWIVYVFLSLHHHGV